MLSSFIPDDERIVTIEDAAELQLKQEHVVRLESRPSNIEGKGEVTIRDLVKNCLRMRPDRIIVGEVRDAAALDMLQAMNTGHDGSICTLHANGPRDALARMETMVLMAGMDLPMRAIREQVASAVDLIVHQTRFKDGTRRITHLTEVERMEGDIITLQDIFVFDHSAGFDAEGKALGTLRATGLRPKFLEKMAHANVTVDPLIFVTGEAVMRRPARARRWRRPPWPSPAPPAPRRRSTRPASPTSSAPTTGLQILVSVPPDATVDTDDVVGHHRRDRRPTATAVPADATTSVRRTAVLVIDTSNSMPAQRIAAAQSRRVHLPRHGPGRRLRRHRHLRQRRDRRTSPRPWTATRPAPWSTDSSSPSRPGSTTACSRASTMAGSDGQRQLLVLSDGADTSDTALGGTADGDRGRRDPRQRGRPRAGPAAPWTPSSS